MSEQTSTDPARPHAVVIGSGFGGLAAAIRLGSRGFRVTVLEQLDAPGGRAYVFRQDGFTFDAGPTIITAPFLLEELWKLCGRRFADDVDLRSLQPFYRIRFFDGSILDCSNDDASMAAQINRFAPGDLAGYGRFLAASEAIYKVAFERLGHVPFDSWFDMVRLAPELVRLGSYRSIYGLAASFVKDPRLRFALSFHPLFVGGNPFNTTSVYGLIAFLERRWGVHFAIGGTGRIVDGMVGLIRGQGSQVRYGAKVAEISVSGSRATGVRLASGERVDADIVVSNADSMTTYGELDPGPAAAPLDRPENSPRALFDEPLRLVFRHEPALSGGAASHDSGGRALSRTAARHLRAQGAGGGFQPVSAPARRPPIPRWRRPGCDAFYVLSPVPHLGGNTDWRSAAEPYRQSISRFLNATLLPDLERHVVTSRVMTPLDFRDRLSAPYGAAFGLAPELTQSAWFRPHNRSEEIQGLYLVGAGTHPGAGVPGVLSSARVLDTVVPDAASFKH